MWVLLGPLQFEGAKHASDYNSRSRHRQVRPAVATKIGLAWPPSGSIPFGDDPMHTVRSKEAVINALTKAVFINRIFEILVGVSVVVAERRCRHAEPIGWLEVV